MTDAERKAADAERLMGEIGPYCDAVEKDAYEALLLESDPAKILEGRQFILASRKFRAALQTAVTLGKQSAKPRAKVA